MKLRNTLLCGVAATALGLAAALPTNSSILPSLTTPAQAQVQASVSVGFGTFYDSLSPHGDWVSVEGSPVWVPGDVNPDWRPYTVGRWVYTRPHGWTWVSDEPYGWAVYHYGRWGFHQTIGWYWVPDTVWAPAWVTWRGSGEYTAWAPMPPQGVVQVSYEVDPYAIPARYWVAVPTTQFLAPNLFSVAIQIGEPNFYDVVRYTRPIGHVTVVGDVVVNNTINVNYIEEVTGENVEIRQVNYTEEAGTVRLGDDALEIYAPAVEEEPDAEPQEVRAPEEIAEERGLDTAAEQADERADQPIELAEDAPELPEQAVNREPAPVTEEDVAEEEAEDERPAATAEEDAEAEAEVTEEETTPPEDTPGAAAVDETPAGEDEEPEAEVTEEETTPPEDTPGAAAVDETPAGQDEEPEAEVTEEETTPPQDTPGAAAVEETPAAQPEAEVTQDQAEPQVEERAIGEPAGQGQGKGQGQGQGQAEEQPQQRGQGQDEDEEDEEQVPQ